jgi:hypothetical protein
MNLPPDFIATITNTFGADGEALIADLPGVMMSELSLAEGRLYLPRVGLGNPPASCETGSLITDN